MDMDRACALFSIGCVLTVGCGDPHDANELRYYGTDTDGYGDASSTGGDSSSSSTGDSGTADSDTDGTDDACTKPEPNCSHEMLDEHSELVPDHGVNINPAAVPAPQPPHPTGGRPTGTLDMKIEGPASGDKCGDDCKFTLTVTMDSRMDLADIDEAVDPATGEFPCWKNWHDNTAEANQQNSGVTAAWLAGIDQDALQPGGMDTLAFTGSYGGDDLSCTYTDEGNGAASLTCTIEVPVDCSDDACNCGGGDENAKTVEVSINGAGDPQNARRGFTADVTMHAAGDDGACTIGDVTATIDNVEHKRWLPPPLAPHTFDGSDPNSCTWGP